MKTKTKGLKPIVAAVLPIVVAVIGAVSVYLWFAGYVTKATNQAEQTAASEKLKTEAASHTTSTDGPPTATLNNPSGGAETPAQDLKPGSNSATFAASTVTAPGAAEDMSCCGWCGGGVCSFAPSSGKRFGSPDGTPATGFNELNGWVAAWGPSDGGVRIALMPGITPPDSTYTGARYTVELNNVQIGTLTVSGGYTLVSITEPMPNFMQVVRIWLEPGGYILYDNGPRPGVVLAPGTYQVKATLRAAPTSDIYGSAADLTLKCVDTPTATITLRVPDPNEWGIRADIYTFTSWPLWPPFGGGYTYRGTWSVGAIYFWQAGSFDVLGLSSPYFTRSPHANTAPKWIAYWIDPAATAWVNWAIKFTGRLYVPWSSIRVGVWQDDGVYVKLCNIDTGIDRWYYTAPTFYTTSGTCTGAPGEYNIEVGFFEGYGAVTLVFIIGPGTGNEAYIPTIDGAWFCPNFKWDYGTCSASWSFVPASPSVPHFRGTNYTPSSTVDGGGSPGP